MEENIPSVVNPDKVQYQEWSRNLVGIYNRHKNSNMFKQAKYGKDLRGISIMDYFLHFLLVKYIENTLIPETNKEIEGKPLTLSKLLVLFVLYSS